MVGISLSRPLILLVCVGAATAPLLRSEALRPFINAFSRTAGLARSGTLYVGGASIGISQVTGTLICSYTLNAASQNLAAAGGAVTVTVTASSDCMWSVSGLHSWITVTGKCIRDGLGHN